MKPQKIILPLAAFFACVSIMGTSLLLYMIKVPSILAVASIYSHIVFDNKEWKAATLELKNKKIVKSQPQDCLRFGGFGYTFALQNYHDLIRENKQSALAADTVILGKDRMLIFGDSAKNRKGFDTVMIDTLNNDPKGKRLFERAAGKPINTEYDYWWAIYSANPNQYSLFDNMKNIGLTTNITLKSVMSSNEKACFHFESDNVKGFEIVNKNYIQVRFFAPSDLDAMYSIGFIGDWTEAEVDAAIGTIRFDK